MIYANRVTTLSRADCGTMAPPDLLASPGPTETVGGIVTIADLTDPLPGSRLVQTWRRDEEGRIKSEWTLIRPPAADAMTFKAAPGGRSSWSPRALLVRAAWLLRQPRRQTNAHLPDSRPFGPMGDL